MIQDNSNIKQQKDVKYFLKAELKRQHQVVGFFSSHMLIANKRI